YREYFKQRVDKKAETLTTAFKANDALMRNLNLDRPDRKTGLPEWFAKLDVDKDGQISLFEWRQGGRSLMEFQEMDLNGDGLLTEDECVLRAAERAVRYARTERGTWVKELEAAYPGKVTDPTTEEGYGAWYALLAGKGDEWARDAAPTPQVAALFDKVVQKMELGPV